MSQPKRNTMTGVNSLEDWKKMRSYKNACVGMNEYTDDILKSIVQELKDRHVFDDDPTLYNKSRVIRFAVNLLCESVEKEKVGKAVDAILENEELFLAQ